MKKILNPGTTPEGWPVFVTIEWDGKRLSITGVEGPLRNGDARGCCGQIDLSDLVTKYNWVSRLMEVWERWHLNDLRAGTPEQEAFLREHPARNYDEACDTLKNAGLYDVNGYRYGQAWLFEEVPDDVIQWLFSLPDTNWV